MLKKLLAAGLLVTLSACSLLPEPSPAPRQLLLASLITAQTSQAGEPGEVRLIIEQPLAATPLQNREIWYRDAGLALTPFSRHLWAESLDRQLQRLVTEYLASQSWVGAVSLDQSGFRADYRLRLHLHEWYLDAESREVLISIQANLLEPGGDSLWQGRWTALPEVESISPQGMVTASQQWLETWVQDLNHKLIQVVGK
ncbi:ABC-type transport auxiliary lipoprotein family protein [Marinospirillum perlucidum]|uniref:ABC-type transport auxiliary lipoprotein family protein n=1 Tax=Marinospirillum perlucidum TaxID=1982602 RepID=UPI000DF1E8E3|nr:ABC-type transport auxiliary lipoprotein family protein [Marinospirillum perlucidum]